MPSLIVSPRNAKELQFIAELMEKMGVQSRLLSEEEKHDLALSALMVKVNRSKKVSRSTIMKKLKG
jgi:hypothetical protein